MSDPLLEAGVRALQAGDAQSAVEHLSLIVARHAENAQAQGYLGMAYARLGRAVESAQHLQAAAALVPDNAPVHFHLGTQLEKAGRAPEALAAYRRAAELAPGDAAAAQAAARLEAALRTPPPCAAAPAFPAAGASSGDATLTATWAPPASVPQGGWEGNATLAGGEATVTATWASAGPAADEPTWISGPAAPAPAAGSTPPWEQPPLPPAPPPVVTAVGAPEEGMTRSERLRKCFQAGAVQGIWWGLIGSFFLFIWSTLMPPGELAKLMPILIALGLGYVALGVTLYGITGLLAASSDEPERLCGNIGLAIGVVEAIFWFPVVRAIIYTMVAGILGCIWISRALGAGLGGTIAEWQNSLFVVTGPRGVGVAPMRSRR